jgi:hypothetical protein
VTPIKPNPPSRSSDYLSQILSVIGLGVAAFLIAVGPAPLNPLNISWIQGFDPIEHYMGWVFYRQGPWSFPIGLSPDFGIDISASVVYADTIPLLSFLFKPFAAILPEPFQYFGWWLLLCFILQATFAHQLCKLFIHDRLTQTIASALLVFTPIVLYRIGVHSSLVAQFIVLAALYLSFRKTQQHRSIYWTVLLCVAVLVHFYLFAMALALWLVNLLDKTISKQISKSHAFKEFILAFSCSIFCAWQAGYFLMGGGALAAGAYGIGRMNILAPFNASGWSYILKPIIGTLAAYESFDYLGAGILLLMLVSIPLLFTQAKTVRSLINRHRLLLVLLILLTLFAITNQIEWGKHRIEVTLPEWLFMMASIMRASARLFWPVYYVIILAIIYVIVKGLPKKVATVVLAIGLLVQIVDTSAGWLPIRQKIARDSAGVDAFTTHLQAFGDSFWDAAGKHYKKVLVVPAQQPPGKIPYDWEKYASYAAKYKMGTNSAYLARVDQGKLDAFHADFEQKVAKGEFDQNALYILGPEKLLPVAMHLDASKDLLARINGMNILAPGWKTCASCPQVPPEYEIHPTIPKTDKDRIIDFSSKGDGKHFLVGVAAWQIVGWGWSYPEAFGVWSEGDKVKLTIPLPKEQINGLELEMRALVSPNYPKQTVEVWVNSQLQKKVILTENQGNKILVDIPPSNNANTPKQDYVTIELRLPNKAKPKDLGLGDDTRELAIGLVGGVWR